MVAKLLEYFRSTPLSKINQESLDGAYKALLTKKTETSGATKIRAILTPLQAIMEHAAIRQWCDRPAFQKPAVARVRMPFLLPDQVDALVKNAAPHLKPLLIFLCGTGVRMSEALELKWLSVDLRGARAVVWQKQDTERHVDLPPRVLAELAKLPHRDGYVFRPLRSRRPKGKHEGKTVGDHYPVGENASGQINAGWAIACHKAQLSGHWREWTPKNAKKPKKQWVSDVTPRSLRNTFATWHYCLHHDLIKLKEDGGWETTAIVARYARKIPDTYRPDIEAWLLGTELGVNGLKRDQIRA